MRRNLGGIVLAALCLIAPYAIQAGLAKPKSGAAEKPKYGYAVTVKAADGACTGLPLTVKVTAPAWGPRSASLRDENVGPVPCTVDIRRGAVEVTWILDLPKGGSRRYDLTLSPKAPSHLPNNGPGVRLKELCKPGPIDPRTNVPFGLTDAVEFTIDGKLLTRYHPDRDEPKPYCWPLIGPTGEPITRAYPMAKVQAESTDHPHHRSLWFAHGDVNGVDFWGESDKAGRIVHREFEVWISGPVMGKLRTKNDWMASDGTRVCEDVREIRAYRVPRGRLLDYEISIKASDGPVKFGDTKEGTFGLRLADSMSITHGEGHILNSEGERDRDAWGKRAEWCDYSGPVADKVVGVAIFDHPDNLRHPTYWHVRDYGLFAANPFGVRDFTGQPEGEPGAYTLAKGQALTFRYRLYLHEGPADVGELTALYDQYAHPPQVTVR